LKNATSTREARRGDGPPLSVVDTPSRITESYADYLTDESGFGPAMADRLVFAHDEHQIAGVLTEAAAAGTCVTVSGARTGIVGGAVPCGGTLLSLAEMGRFLGARTLADGRRTLRAQAGVSIATLRQRLDAGDVGADDPLLPDENRRELDALAKESSSYFYPPDPTEDTAHLGATVMTNASGARSFRYGPTRPHVHAISVCLPGGDVLEVERGGVVADGRSFTIGRTDGSRTEILLPGYTMPGTKNAAGYYVSPGMDLIDLFIGSEGTLGVLTEVEILLTTRPTGFLSALAFFPSDEQALDLVRHARGDIAGRPAPGSVAPVALELFDSRSFDFLRERKADEGSASKIPELPEDARAGILFEQDYDDEDALMEVYEGWEELLEEHGSSMERTWGGMEEADLERLLALRHSVAEEVNHVIARAKAEHPEIHKIGTDAAVPPQKLEEMFRFYRERLDGTGLSYVIFGHVGDSHLHLNIMPRDEGELRVAEDLALSFAERAVGLGGTVSAEHGIGKLKHEFLKVLYGEDGIAQMAAVKRAFDPAGILNRGVMFPGDVLSSR
jgi:D-lactate dehydrogenase (cytochrome)